MYSFLSKDLRLAEVVVGAKDDEAVVGVGSSEQLFKRLRGCSWG